MLNERVKVLLNSEFRPLSKAEFEAELSKAKEKGYKIPDIDFDSLIITREQAKVAISRFNVSSHSSFYEFMVNYRDFPLGAGEELLNLNLFVEENTGNNRYLRFTSVEGEGSYYYDLITDAVYDVDWGEEDELEAGGKDPWFSSFDDFIEWYYL